MARNGDQKVSKTAHPPVFIFGKELRASEAATARCDEAVTSNFQEPIDLPQADPETTEHSSYDCCRVLELRCSLPYS